MSKRLLIGSRAIYTHFHDFPRGQWGSDWDYISQNMVRQSKEQDIHYSPAFEWVFEHYPDRLIPPPDVLYTIKCSHATWDIHWEKTMSDIGFLQTKGCKIIDEFYSLLYKDWENIHGAKKVNLNVPNEEFFTSKVYRKYDHDWLHSQMMYYDQPMYDKLKIDKSRAWIEKKLFDNLSKSDKIRTVKEEACVVALERTMIPSAYTASPVVAYRRALKSLITSMTKGWFPRFIIENWNDIKTLEDCDKYLAFIKNRREENDRERTE